MSNVINYIPDAAIEKKNILKKYKDLLASLYDKTNKTQRQSIRKAFVLAVNAHKDMRRKTGEPYIYHPLAVAKIVTKEINLGTTSVICALLHDVVEDTDYTIDDIRDILEKKLLSHRWV